MHRKHEARSRTRKRTKSHEQNHRPKAGRHLAFFSRKFRERDQKRRGNAKPCIKADAEKRRERDKRRSERKISEKSAGRSLGKSHGGKFVSLGDFCPHEK